MSALDRDRLLRFLRLTDSDNDGEALNALRMAQRYMKSTRATWDSLLVPIPPLSTLGRTVSPEPKRGPMGRTVRRQPYKADMSGKHVDGVQELIDSVSQMKHDMGTLMYVSAINQFWQKNGYVTHQYHGALSRLVKGGKI